MSLLLVLCTCASAFVSGQQLVKIQQRRTTRSSVPHQCRFCRSLCVAVKSFLQPGYKDWQYVPAANKQPVSCKPCSSASWHLCGGGTVDSYASNMSGVVAGWFGKKFITWLLLLLGMCCDQLHVRRVSGEALFVCFVFPLYVCTVYCVVESGRLQLKSCLHNCCWKPHANHHSVW
jgi:hypothetical protein